MPDFIQRFKSAGRILLKGNSPAVRRRKSADIPPITAQEVVEAKAFFPVEKFFIYGHARSGTTLLARLARLHPQVHCNYQAHFFTRTPLLESLVSDPDAAAWLGRHSNRWNHGRDLSPLVLRAAADFILERDARLCGKGGPGCVVGDKSPNSLLDGEAVRLACKVYPDARLVYILRDGRDTALSHRFQAFIDTPQKLSREDLSIREAFAQEPGPFLRGERSLFTEKNLRQAAEGWVKNVVETNQQGQALYGERYFSLRYEDLIENPVAEMSLFWAFLGVEPASPEVESAVAAEMQANPDADWQQQKASEIATPLQKGQQGSWRQLFTGHDRQVFNEIAAETLAAWGYPLE